MLRRYGEGGADSREFELPGEDAIMRKEGERLIIEPTPPQSLLAVLATLASLDEDFPHHRRGGITVRGHEEGIATTHGAA